MPGLPPGHGLGRLTLRLQGPRTRVTDQEIETVGGEVIEGVAEELVLYVNGTARELVADSGPFETSIPLQQGLNQVRAVARDWRGVEAEDTITVKYIPPPVPNGIAITSPKDGYVLPHDAPPIILVEGRVEDLNVSTVWLVANDRRITVRARNGRFHKALPVLEPVLHLRAEFPLNGGSPPRSSSVTVRAPSPNLSHVLLLLEWPQEVAGNHVTANATWRARPERLDVPIRKVPLKHVGPSKEDFLPEAFYVRMMPGVYTFLLQSRVALTGIVRATLVLPESGRLKARSLRGITVKGTGDVVLAKVLLPQGVFWEQDDWFSGQSESSYTVTKFRFPEGVTWTERKNDFK